MLQLLIVIATGWIMVSGHGSVALHVRGLPWSLFAAGLRSTRARARYTAPLTLPTLTSQTSITSEARNFKPSTVTGSCIVRALCMFLSLKLEGTGGRRRVRIHFESESEFALDART